MGRRENGAPTGAYTFLGVPKSVNMTVATLTRSDRQEEIFLLLNFEDLNFFTYSSTCAQGRGELHRNLFQPVKKITFCPSSDLTGYALSQLVGSETWREAQQGVTGSKSALPLTRVHPLSALQHILGLLLRLKERVLLIFF